MKNVIVPLNAFGRSKVLENGQAFFIESIAHAEAFGVEIRRELLSVQDPQLEHIKNEIDKYGLFTVYSAPIECWKEDASLNEEGLTEVFQEGRVLGAKWIKVSLGYYNKDVSNFLKLNNFLNQHQEIQLLVENDQTSHGGNVNRLVSFFENAYAKNVPVKMTFDAGNWYYTDQDVGYAMSKLAPYVMYLHLKQVEKKDNHLITVPLEKEGNHNWKNVLNDLPIHISTALEFPIEPIEKLEEYIHMVSELAAEREALLCNS
jgi:sugar phosphate isomerase/epimerase